jgi:predicted ATPase/DNA-binding CsgD family transcriptional regulator
MGKRAAHRPTHVRLVERETALATTVPQPVTTLLGREQELAAIGTLLCQPDVRLVNLTGPGGVGKTRLALGVADDVAGFDDGIAFVGLASVRDAAFVVPAIAQALGMREASDRPAIQRLSEAFDERRLLLVLDNFEQVIEAASELGVLLTACPRLSMLVTSRSRLRLSGERVFPVLPLALPNERDRASDPATCAAVRLFVERALTVEPDFMLTEANTPAVVDICRRLDGLPLAIELAAARSNILSAPALRQRLEQRLPLLVGGARDLPARLQTMRSAIAWSYDLLAADERALFRRLAVFVGGFTLEAAETVIGGESHLAIEVVDGVAALVDASLLQREEIPGESESRYMMLETVREYGLEALAVEGEEDDVRRRHAARYLALAMGAHAISATPEEPAAFDKLEREHDNLRAALGWAIERGEAELGVRMAGALRPFWFSRGHLSEGRRWLIRILDFSGHLPIAARMEALYAAGVLAYHQSDFTVAIDRGKELLAAAEHEDHPPAVLLARYLLGMVAFDQGELERAEEFLIGALTSAQEQDDRKWIALALTNLAAVVRKRGDLARARALLDESLVIWRDLRASWGNAVANFGLATIALAEGDCSRAATHYRTSLALHRKERDLWGITQSLVGAAAVARHMKWMERVARLLGASDKMREATGGGLSYGARESFDELLAIAWAELGEADFRAAWDAGRALTVDLAMDEADALLAVAEQSSAPRHQDDAATWHGLTPRELQVLRLVVAGQSDREIAETLFISRRTAEGHVAGILAKLDVRSRAAAVAAALGSDIVPPGAGDLS